MTTSVLQAPVFLKREAAYLPPDFNGMVLLGSQIITEQSTVGDIGPVDRVFIGVKERSFAGMTLVVGQHSP